MHQLVVFRPEGAPTGSEFAKSIMNLPLGGPRENAIFHEVTSGNIPDFLTNFVEVSSVSADGHEVVFDVMPDVLCVGTNEDYLRVPMSPLTAQRIADLFLCSLPTTQMSDLIWEHAPVKVPPMPSQAWGAGRGGPAGPAMTSTQWMVWHNDVVEESLAKLGSTDRSVLTAGHKKDVVLANRLANFPDRVTIYGWHQTNGKPIQKLQGTPPHDVGTLHENTYADYSHGIRLISSTILLDGAQVQLADVLSDPKFCKLLSDEGVVKVFRQPGVKLPTPIPSTLRNPGA